MLSAVCLALAIQFAQGNMVPSHWLGSWTMNPARSTFDAGAPVVPSGQTLTIDATLSELRLRGDTVLADGRHVPEMFQLSLAGAPTTLAGGIVVFFKHVDSETFEIVVSMGAPAANVLGTNRFSFSADRRSLVETKTQTVGGRTIASVLVFDRED